MWPGAHPHTCIVHTHSQCCMGGHFHIVSLLHKGEMRELGLQHGNELTSIFASELTNCLGFDRTKPLPWHSSAEATLG